jgi:DNA modification methylase
LSHIAESLRPLAVPVTEIQLDPANARLHDERNLDAIKASLAAFGQRKPVVINRRTGYLEAGNGTLQAALSLGWNHLAVVYVDDDPSAAAGFSIADNQSATLATWDKDKLASLLELTDEDDERLSAMLADLRAEAGLEPRDGLVDADEVPLPPDEPTTKPGDLWLLGQHRLLCADSAKSEDVDRLLGGARVHLAHCDPPYGVKVEPRSNNAIASGLSSFEGTRNHQKLDLARHPEKAKPTNKKMRAKDRPLTNDFVSETEFNRLLRAWFGNLARVLLPGRCFVIWGGYANLANYPSALRECGLYFSQGIVWEKGWPVLTRKDFMGAYELAFYGWKEGAGHQFFGPNNATDLWHVRKVSPQSMIHLTEKPVELAVRAMQYSSRAGENVLDLFGGSGSSLIAAEQTGRRAFVMELDPAYCDVIVERYEKFTGKKAERHASQEGNARKSPARRN